MTTTDQAPRRRGIVRWWHGLRPVWRRSVRQSVVVLLTGVLAAVIGIFTANAEISVGPHEARIATSLAHVVRLDLGPLGAVEIPSPAPWPLGVQVDIGEIPATLTEVDDPLASLGGDVVAYSAFFSEPQAAVRDAALALGSDALHRTVLLWSILLVVIAGGQLAAGGLLRTELRAKLRRQGVGQLAAVTALALVAVPVAAALEDGPDSGRPSQVLASLGGPLAEARVTGQVAALLDTYGELALAELRKNDEFYDVLKANVATAYSQVAEPLAPRRPLVPFVPAVVVVEEPEVDGATAEAEVEAEVEAEASAEVDADADASDATGESTPSPTPTRDLLEPDPVTLMIISDNHCNIGMGRVFGEIARQSRADVVLNGGDSTLGGSSVESICIDSVASELKHLPVVVADGNHDSPETGTQGAAAGWTVLDGGVVEVEGLRIVGDRDARLTSVTLGTQQYLTRTEQAAALSEAACDGVDPEDPSTLVDILLLHDPYTGARVMQSGCVALEVSGHLHRRVGPLQQGTGLAYLNASSGGAKEGSVPLGPLTADAYVTILVYDRANHVPLALREIIMTPEQEVKVGRWEPFPVVPSEPVTADLSLEAWPRR